MVSDSAELRSSLLTICIQAPESTTNCLSSGSFVDAAGRNQSVAVVLSFSFSLYMFLARFHALLRAHRCCLCKGNVPCTSYSRTFGYGILTWTTWTTLRTMARTPQSTRVQCAVLSTPRTVCWCTVSHIALVAQRSRLVCHSMSSMHAHLCVVLWASLLTRLSTSSSCSPSSCSWCPTRRLTSSPSKIPCATPAWGAWSLWTMSHTSQVMSPRRWSSQTLTSWTSRPPATSTCSTPWTTTLPSQRSRRRRQPACGIPSSCGR